MKQETIHFLNFLINIPKVIIALMLFILRFLLEQKFIKILVIQKEKTELISILKWERLILICGMR